MTTRSVESVAWEGLRLAEQCERDIEKHEKICAERYTGINTEMGNIKTGLDDINKTLFRGLVTLVGLLSAIVISTAGYWASRSDARVDRASHQLETAR